MAPTQGAPTIASCAVHALIIAIDRYQHEPIPSLRGCVNDGKDFQKFLKQSLNASPTNILTLTNESATRDNILAAFEGHLIHNERVKQGDLIFFFYAGYGDCVDAPEDWGMEGKRSETICPFDESAFEGQLPSDDGTIYPIPARTFNVLMRRLAEKKGDNVVAIFDCSYSRGGSPNNAACTTSVLSRSLPGTLPRLPLPTSLDKEVLAESSDGGATFAALDGFGYRGMTSHILLSACQPEETAMESCPVDGTVSRGLFTVNILDVLRGQAVVQKSSRTTYASLVDVLSTSKQDRMLHFGLRHQHPFCEGEHKDRLLFTVDAVGDSESHPFSITYESGALYVSAGHIHGVTESTTWFVCLLPNADPNSSVMLVAIKVLARRSQVYWHFTKDRLSRPLEALHGAKASITIFDPEPVEVVLRPEPTIGQINAFASGGVEVTTHSTVTTQESHLNGPLTQPPDTRIFALVIAIDNYQNKSITPLQGCVNDGNDFVKFLTETLGVPLARIVKLVNEDATREAILRNFQQHLISNSDINRGDAVVFFYAGHGDREKAPALWSIRKGDMVETISPYDVQTKNGQEAVHGIPDRTFDWLMRRLAQEKGDNILAIFDSCHSGGMARGEPPVPGRTRALGPEVKRYPISETLDQAVWTWRPKGDIDRDARPVVSEGFYYAARNSHVLLAACREDEKARENEVVVDGDGRRRSRGMFTHYLLMFLRRAYAQKEILCQLTYARLMDALVGAEAVELCRVPLLGQHPICEGNHKDRLLLTQNELAGEEHSFAIKRDENGILRVAAGSINGVVKGTQFALQASQGIVFTTTQVDALECTVAVQLDNSEAPVILPHTRVVVSAWRSMPMKVRTTVELPIGGILSYSKTKYGEYYDVSLDKSFDPSTGPKDPLLRWVVGRRDPLTFQFARPNTVCWRPLEASVVLDIVARWNFHLYRFSDPASLSRQIRPRVELRALRQTGLAARLLPLMMPDGDDMFKDARAEEVQSSLHSTYTVPEVVKEARIYDFDKFYGLTLYNDSEFGLWPYLFYFDPNTYAIQPWYLPPNSSDSANAPLPSKSGDQPGQLCIGYGNGGVDAFEFSLPSGAERDTGFLKIFVSTHYVDMRGIQQDGLDDAERGVKQTPVKPLAVWDSLVLSDDLHGVGME
ncbi:caspase domain-containing protein [Fomitopsis serialis]|uniref:caspase domain-containing protein n=1 Tax=Fomitopsis serialis TaxID=139415 RepID=UPI002007E082|nr:caspase domain-containing protein [Neoantrodia serialis]KAH9923544.1 caspase domain-containing protein [Neoantrodia serialis]